LLLFRDRIALDDGYQVAPAVADFNALLNEDEVFPLATRLHILFGSNLKYFFSGTVIGYHVHCMGKINSQKVVREVRCIHIFVMRLVSVIFNAIMATNTFFSTSLHPCA